MILAMCQQNFMMLELGEIMKKGENSLLYMKSDCEA